MRIGTRDGQAHTHTRHWHLLIIKWVVRAHTHMSIRTHSHPGAALNPWWWWLFGAVRAPCGVWSATVCEEGQLWKAFVTPLFSSCILTRHSNSEFVKSVTEHSERQCASCFTPWPHAALPGRTSVERRRLKGVPPHRDNQSSTGSTRVQNQTGKNRDGAARGRGVAGAR